jgi:threonylcarbamoyladenosine tRNA methylthiotransferase MtaB
MMVLHRFEQVVREKLVNNIRTRAELTSTTLLYIAVSSFYVENFGCRASQADGASLERQFGELGLTKASDSRSADVVVLNTCTVTESADQDARAAVRRVRRHNSACRIVVTGCYAQRAAQEIAALPGVSAVIGNSHKHELAQLALGATEWGHPANQTLLTGFVPISTLAEADAGSETTSPIYVSDIFAHTELIAAPVFEAANARTRPNLKVQDGCDNRCSFCVIPYVRGQSRSLQLDDVIREVQGLVDSGYREVVISGINLGRWGRDLGGSLRFETLVEAILLRTSLEKLRISSVEPMDWSDELIGIVTGSSRIAKHAHVPMQSGSDRILRKMHRKYRPWHYREKIEKIRAAMPNAAIGADVMVGFPGETEDDFAATRRMIEELPFTYLHVFTYSSRPGTPAAAMDEKIPVRVARDRNRGLREIVSSKKRAFLKSFVGERIDAITLNVSNERTTEALTDNYLKLQIDGNHEANRWVSVLVQDAEVDHLRGAVVQC